MLGTEKQLHGKYVMYVSMQEQFLETTFNRRFMWRLEENLKTLLHVIHVLWHLATEFDVNRNNVKSIKTWN